MSATAQGLDRAAAPDAATAKRMLDEIGGRWWCVYIGGPTSSASGWTPQLVNEYVSHGIDRFMLTYAGRQWGGPLTAAQGRADAKDALRLAADFGYSGGYPLCLDVEQHTYDTHPTGTVEYARAWCAAVKAAGARPGVYANPHPLLAMHGQADADFVWVASWISHGVVRHDPRAAPGVPGTHWASQGQRAWQYAGAFGNGPCRVRGLDVDINVADLDCLAGPPGVHAAPVPIRGAARGRVLRLGDHGKGVERVTRRLSFVRSHATGKPYLDGKRTRFDAQTVAALKAFQAEHHLSDDGVFGTRSDRALSRSVRLEKARRAPAHHDAGLVALVNELHRDDAEAERDWQAIVAYGSGRRHALARARDHAVDLADLARLLARIERGVDTLIQLEEHPAAAVPTQTTAQTAAPLVEGNGAEAAVATTLAPAAEQTTSTTAPPAPPLHTPVRLADLSDEVLLERIDRLDHAIGRARDVMIGRYALVEKEIGRVTHTHPPTPAPGPPPAPAPAPAHPQPPTPARIGVRNLQRLLNQFTQQHLKGMAPLAVDGRKGMETKKRIKLVRYYLGYGRKGGRSTGVDAELVRRLRRPGSPRLSNPAMLARARTRRRRQHKNAQRIAAPRAGVATFDGKPVAAWMKPYLDWARAQGWQGTLSSGWRDPAYSESLCMGICRAPRCPGRCAGRSSNHVGRVKPAGAIDVTHYDEFGRLMQSCPYSPRIFNDLPADRVHFSASGH